MMPATCDVDLAALLGPEARRSPEMADLWAWLLERQTDIPNWLDLAASEARASQNRLYALWNAELPMVESMTPLRIPGSPPVPAELFVPRNADRGCILFLHGGGWAFGNLRSHDRFVRLLADATQTRVLSVDYRLAPEHPFPAPLDDCCLAWRWLAAAAEADPDLAGPLSIAGDSAGANLALGVTLDAIARGRRRPDLALLFYGVFSADLDSPSYRRFGEGYGLTRAGMARFWDWYAPPDRPALRRDPRLSGVDAPTADLAQLPAVFLNAAGLDPLLSDTLMLAERLRLAHVAHELVIHTGVHHGFMQMTSRLDEARDAFARAATFQRAQAAHVAAGQAA